MSRIVLVDDEAHILRGLTRLIQRIGQQYQIVGAFGDSAEALEYIKQHGVDVLITDIRMPGMDGLALAQQAKKVKKDLHCIILSGYSDFEYARNAIKIGVVDYLVKPIDDEELRKTLSKVVEKGTETVEQSEYYIQSDVSREVAWLKHEIENHYATFDLAASAERLCKSREYLSKLFKKETGMYLKDYLKEVRILRAKDLLSHIDSYKIYEVSELVGFADTVYFSKQFKELVGVTPKEYQQRCFPSGEEAGEK